MSRGAGAALAVLAWMAPPALAQPEAADLVLTNGKVVTVDERFRIAQAVAVTGQRFAAVGSDREVARLAGPATRRIDLEGRTVIPGLIDNHMHLLRAGLTWRREVRWDGVTSRGRALAMLRERADVADPGEWVFNLGGWTIDQFADDPRPFTRRELDRAVPENPVLLQAAYYETYLNSRAIQALGLEARGEPWIARDAAGEPTGRIGEQGVWAVAAGLPVFDAPAEEIRASTEAMLADLNRAGITSVGSAGCEPALLETYRAQADAGRLRVRVFCITSFRAGDPDEVDEVLPRIARMELFQGDARVDHVAYGEGVYGPLHDPMFRTESDPGPGTWSSGTGSPRRWRGAGCRCTSTRTTRTRSVRSWTRSSGCTPGTRSGTWAGPSRTSTIQTRRTWSG